MDDAEMAAEYRKRAAELLKIAEVFKDPATREEMLTLAAEWQYLAERADARAHGKAQPQQPRR